MTTTVVLLETEKGLLQVLRNLSLRSNEENGGCLELIFPYQETNCGAFLQG